MEKALQRFEKDSRVLSCYIIEIFHEMKWHKTIVQVSAV